MASSARLHSHVARAVCLGPSCSRIRQIGSLGRQSSKIDAEALSIPLPGNAGRQPSDPYKSLQRWPLQDQLTGARRQINEVTLELLLREPVAYNTKHSVPKGKGSGVV